MEEKGAESTSCFNKYTLTIMCHVGMCSLLPFHKHETNMKQTFPNKTEIQTFGDEPLEGSLYIPILFQNPEAFTS